MSLWSQYGNFFMPTFCSTNSVALCFNVSAGPYNSVENLALVGSIPELGDWKEERFVNLHRSKENPDKWTCIISPTFLPAYFQYRYIFRDNDGNVTLDDLRAFRIPESRRDVVDSHLPAGGKILFEIADIIREEGSRIRVFAPEHYTANCDRIFHCFDPQALSVLRDRLRDIKTANQKLRADVVSMASKFIISPPMPESVDSRESDAVIRRLLAEINELKGKVKVVCRFRPISTIPGVKESIRYTINRNEGTVTISDSSDVYNPVREFHMDDVFPEESTNLDFFLSGKLKSLIESSVIIQNNVCVFAYGQTSSGKTHTMIGNEDEEGVTQMTISTIYDTISASNLHRIIEAEVIEVYRENVFKLAPMTRVDGRDDLSLLFNTALADRATAPTNMNQRSSRSHCVFILSLTDPETNICSKIYLVDLAGSERTKFSGAEGDRLAEANSINKSLSTLGLVLNGLLNKRKFIPYRDSKLTHLLAPVFTKTSPPSKVLMIANVSPSSSDFKETLSTLTFAQRVGDIEMRSGIQEEDKKQINQKMDQINDLITDPKRRLSRSRSFCV